MNTPKRPTSEDLAHPLFEPIYQAIRDWEIKRAGDGDFTPATGIDVVKIIDAIRDASIPTIVGIDKGSPWPPYPADEDPDQSEADRDVGSALADYRAMVGRE